MRDERTCPHPEVFNPTRYLDTEGRLRESDPSDAAFGFGRRICPGRYFAVDTIWVAMVHILATFDIEKARDKTGKVIEPSGECTFGLVV